jgi:hypothetical protein
MTVPGCSPAEPRAAWIALALTMVFGMAACGPAPPSSARQAGAPNSGAAPGQAAKKTITIAYGRVPTSLGPIEGSVAEFREIAHAGCWLWIPSPTERWGRSPPRAAYIRTDGIVSMA